MVFGLVKGLVDRFKRPVEAPLNVVVTVKNKSELTDTFLDEIKTHVSEYTLRIFDDSECSDFLEKHYGEDFARKFERINRGRHKADFFRYAYLYLHGGMYIDVNTRLIRPLDQVIQDRSACYIVEKIQGRSMHNGFVYTPPNNPFMHMMLMAIFMDDSVQNVGSDIHSIDFKSFNIINICCDKHLRTGRNHTKIGIDVVLYYSCEDMETSNQSNRYAAIYTDQKIKVMEERNPLNLSDYESSLRRREVLKSPMPLFSEHGEDEWVISHMRYKRDGYYIDIGTEDGKNKSNTYLLDVRFGWKGVCIASTMKNMGDRSAKQHQGMISNRYSYRRKSFDNDTNIKRDSITLIDILFEEFKVPKLVDYLCINSIGLDIVSGIDFTQYCFEIISIRHNNIETYRYEMHGFLKHKGYSFKIKFRDTDFFVFKPKYRSSFHN